MSVLNRIGKGLVSFGSGIPQVQLDQMNAAAQNSQTVADTNQFRLEQEQAGVQADADRQQQMQSLARAAFDPNNPDRDAALAEMFVQDPDLGDQYAQSIKARDQQHLEEISLRSAQIFATPPEQRRSVILRQAAEIEATGGDASDTLELLEMAPEDQDNVLRFSQLAALNTKERLALQSGADTPAGQREHQALVDAANGPAGTARDAARVKLGLDARAGISAAERIAADPELTDAVADSQATIREAGKFADATGADRAKFIGDGVVMIQKIDANIRNLDRAVEAIDQGASTGAIESRFFPTFRDSTVALEQVQSQLGLDVVGSTQFGALSKGELDLALRIALPTGKQPAELKQWIIDKQAAQSKLRDYYNEQIRFLADGGSIAEFMASKGGGEQQTSGKYTIKVVD